MACSIISLEGQEAHAIYFLSRAALPEHRAERQPQKRDAVSPAALKFKTLCSKPWSRVIAQSLANTQGLGASSQPWETRSVPSSYRHAPKHHGQLLRAAMKCQEHDKELMKTLSYVKSSVRWAQ